MKILNPASKIIGKVVKDDNNWKSPFHFRYIGNNNITFPVHANGIGNACVKVCKFFGEGYFFEMFTI